MSDTPQGETSAHGLLAEQGRRWRQGERVPVEALLAAHPTLGAAPDAILDLIYNELVLRERPGATVTGPLPGRFRIEPPGQETGHRNLPLRCSTWVADVIAVRHFGRNWGRPFPQETSPVRGRRGVEGKRRVNAGAVQYHQEIEGTL
jgi:hypothetical protein